MTLQTVLQRYTSHFCQPCFKGTNELCANCWKLACHIQREHDLKAVARFVAEHDLAPTMRDGAVHFAVEYTAHGKVYGETIKARTMTEARQALGY